MEFSVGTKNKHKFSVDDSWWLEAKMADFMPGAEHYTHTGQDGVRIVVLSHVEPRIRSRGFNRTRFLRILKGFRKGRQIPPIEVLEYEGVDGYLYRIVDGFHRFHASVAAGFTHIPALVSVKEKGGTAAGPR